MWRIERKPAFLWGPITTGNGAFPGRNRFRSVPGIFRPNVQADPSASDPDHGSALSGGWRSHSHHRPPAIQQRQCHSALRRYFQEHQDIFIDHALGASTRYIAGKQCSCIKAKAREPNNLSGFHEIKVVVNRPKPEVSTRSGTGSPDAPSSRSQGWRRPHGPLKPSFGGLPDGTDSTLPVWELRVSGIFLQNQASTWYWKMAPVVVFFPLGMVQDRSSAPH